MRAATNLQLRVPARPAGQGPHEGSRLTRMVHGAIN
jgi:hypothetical protein